MLFKISMFLYILLVPTIIGGAGIMMYKRPPKKEKYIYGFITEQSMINDNTWFFAQKFCGQLWFRTSIPMFIVSFVLGIIIMFFDNSVIAISACCVCIIQALIVYFSVMPVEKALIKNFDKNGKRR